VKLLGWLGETPTEPFQISSPIAMDLREEG